MSLLDQILALKWVRDNIEYLGGNPEHVILIGQSAGAKSVLNLMLAKEARGLFHGAVAMSGALQEIKDRQTMNMLAGIFLEILDIPLDAPQELERVSTEAI